MIFLLCLLIGAQCQGSHIALIYSDLMGETLEGEGTLQEVSYSSMSSGIDTLLTYFLKENVDIFPIWDTANSTSLSIKEKFRIQCQSGVGSIVILANTEIRVQADIYLNEQLITSARYTDDISLNLVQVSDEFFNYCEDNQLRIEISTLHPPIRWIWYSVSIAEAELQRCPPCSYDCPNGILQPSEECDDGNLDRNDGCSENCMVEEGWVCPRILGIQSVCSSHQQFCGNGFREFYLAQEGCDDGNLHDGDGCSSQCQVEEGFICKGTLPSICSQCGNLILDETEECDDGGRQNGDGCSSTCRIEPHYLCSSAVPPSCQRQPFCGDEIIQDEEECDDGNEDDQDGCNECSTEPGWNCTIGEEGSTTCSRLCFINGTVEEGEQCDDDNEIPGDGCHFCQIEEGWQCIITESLTTVCQQLEEQQTEPIAECGNGLLEPLNLEECDDGNSVKGDGCSDTCRIEQGYRCWTLSQKQISRISSQQQLAQSLCFLCGDGKISFIEECDDGNTNNGDGCSADCTLES